MRIKIILFASLTTLGLTIWACNRSSSAPTEPQVKLVPAATKPRTTKPPMAVQTPVDAPSSRRSVIPSQEDKFVENARKLIVNNSGAARAQAWSAILPQANFDQLVKLTEIVAQPKLDDERTKLRRAAVEHLAEVGKLPEFIQLRQNYDKGFSLVQIMAWEVWAKTSPQDAVKAWHTRLTTTPPAEGEHWWTHAVTAGLKQATTAAATEAIRYLPECHRRYFPKELQ